MSGGIVQNPTISDRKQGRFEAHFRIQGTSRAVVRPAPAKGFRRRGASSSGNCATRRQFGGVRVHCKEIIRFELRIIGPDLQLGYTTSKPLQNLLNGDPVTAKAGFPKPHTRIDRDPSKERIVARRHLCPP